VGGRGGTGRINGGNEKSKNTRERERERNVVGGWWAGRVEILKGYEKAKYCGDERGVRGATTT
jgi:hypothetical protein